jgi:hypothetical protein
MPKFIEVDLLTTNQEYRMINVDGITLIVPGASPGSTIIHVGRVGDNESYVIFESYESFVRRLEDLLLCPAFINGAPSRRTFDDNADNRGNE